VQNATLYIAEGNFSDGQNRHDASHGIQLFQIEGSAFKTPALFPNESSRVSVEFDARSIDVQKMDPVIEQDGQVVKIPIVEEKAKEQVFNGAYKVYRFDGTRFQLE
jgi:phosphatidylserine decarboxylase